MFSSRLATALLLLVGQLAVAEVRVEDARLRALLPGQNKTAGYFDITNDGPRPVTLVGASSPAAGAIEMHRIIHDGDMVRMRRVEKVVIAPAETVRFQPGGLHLMLFRVDSLPQRTQIQLQTSAGEPIDAVFRLVAPGVAR